MDMLANRFHPLGGIPARINKINKIEINVDAVSGEMLDASFFFADNPEEPYAASEFAKDSKTQNKIKELIAAFAKTLAKHRINSDEEPSK